MFCKNCGADILPGAAICIKCGFAKDNGDKFCSNCGAEVIPGASVCTKCGSILDNSKLLENQKSKLVAIILAFFLGFAGVHDFYLGYSSLGVLKILVTLLTCGTLSWVWPLVDIIKLLTGSIKTDANGNPLKQEF